MPKMCFEAIASNDLDSVINGQGITVLFKHSTRCAISSTALHRVESFCTKSDLPLSSYLVNVIQERSISNELAEKLAIKHESPQVIVIKNGKLAFHASHFDITEERLLSVVNEA